MNLPPLPYLGPGIEIDGVRYFTTFEVLTFARIAQREAVAAAVPGWMPIESAPKDGTVILLFRYYVCAARWNPENDPDYPWQVMPIGAIHGPLEENGFEGVDSAITHWMPLPAPPTTPEGCETCTTECRAVELGRECPAVPFEKVNCWCESCDMAVNGLMRSRMSLCPDCGNKRCPKAKHHDASCSGSNDPNQEAQP